jgi:lipopolysaccharide export system protein LptA
MNTSAFNKAGLTALILGCLIFSSCTTNFLTGQTIKELRDVPAFNAVTLAFSGDVFIKQGSPQKVEIEADKSSMEVIETKVDDNRLVLKTKNGHWRDLGKINVYITMPQVSHLSVSGSGDMKCESSIQTNEIKLEVSGSGSIALPKLESPDVSAVITGSGDITVAGSNAQSNLQATITGSGSFNAEKLQVDNAHINIAGSGSARIYALKQLETNITGSGNVLYKGNPIVNANATGSGRTKSLD